MSAPRAPREKPDAFAGLSPHDTIAALATAPGRSAVALVRMSGPDAFAIASRCLSPWPLAPRRAMLVSVRRTQTGDEVDRALATVFPAPHSFTGDDVVEISTHGGAFAAPFTLAALIGAGAREAHPGEFTRRALLNGKIDLVQAEAIGDLIDAPSGQYYRAALSQLSGALSNTIAGIRDALLDLEALLAYDVDFPDEDEGPVAPERVTRAASDALASIERMLSTLPAARITREGAVVVLAGVPNTGKSSLFNALLGESRAIVTEHAGTTRDAIDALVDSDPYPLRLVDTAGLRDASDPVERLGVEVSERWLARADIVLVCGTSRAERETAAAAVQSDRAATLRVHTMADRTPGDVADADVVLSANAGTGLAELRHAIAAALATRYPIPAQTPLILRARHEHALRTARAELQLFLDAWRARTLPVTIAAVHVRAAVTALDVLIGAVDVDDVLARVFERFCVGK